MPIAPPPSWPASEPPARRHVVIPDRHRVIRLDQGGPFRQFAPESGGSGAFRAWSNPLR